MGERCWFYCRVVLPYMFGGLLDEDGSARSPGPPSSPVSAIEINFENSAIWFLSTSCRLELSFRT